MILSQVVQEPAGQILSQPVTWFAAGKLHVDFTINRRRALRDHAGHDHVHRHLDRPLLGRLHEGDEGYARFFAVMSLFVFSMCGLVLANNFLLLVAFWEGVGLCSYLLVGFYFEKPSAAAAARKAFLVTRIGDTGFILGIFLLWKMGGWHTDLTALFDHIAKNPPDQASLTTACLLLFCGAVGKSAQFPLYVWLPDAMEGPTPVSALIHAATMVTAGVYLLARVRAAVRAVPGRADRGRLDRRRRRPSSRRSSHWPRPTSSACWPTRPSASSASCSSHWAQSARSARRSP